jgi:cell division protein FtsQ
MKRPEGFDRVATPPAAPDVPTPSRRKKSNDAAGSAARETGRRHQDSAKAVPKLSPKAKRSPVSSRRKERPAVSASEEESRNRAAAAREAHKEASRAARERRRFERAEVRRFTRRSRNRRAGWITAASTVVVLLVLVAVAVYSPLLALEKIEITGTSRVPVDQVQAAVDEQVGTPLALVDYDKFTRQLSEFPLIRSYVTEAVPPHTLVIHIVERQPVASIMTATGYTLVDPAGVEIEKSDTRPLGVPIVEITGVKDDGAVFDSAVEVLLALPAPLLNQIDRVTATTMDDVTLVFTGVGQRVVWGSADRSELKARVLERLMTLHDPSALVEYDVTAPLSAVVRPG